MQGLAPESVLMEQVAEALGKSNHVKAYDRREPRNFPKFVPERGNAGRGSALWAWLRGVPFTAFLSAAAVLAGTPSHSMYNLTNIASDYLLALRSYEHLLPPSLLSHLIFPWHSNRYLSFLR